MVRKYLSKKHVILEEDLLEMIADNTDRMVQLRKNPPSPLYRGKRISGTKEKHVILEEDLLEMIADNTDRMVQLRKNPPSPLYRGKRISGTKEKFRKSGSSIVGPSISPSPTTGSFGSGLL
jgi:hypothetical protein